MKQVPKKCRLIISMFLRPMALEARGSRILNWVFKLRYHSNISNCNQGVSYKSFSQNSNIICWIVVFSNFDADFLYRMILLRDLLNIFSCPDQVNYVSILPLDLYFNIISGSNSYNVCLTSLSEPEIFYMFPLFWTSNEFPE